MLRFPVLVAQAMWVVARVTRLPEAAGPREGRAGPGQDGPGQGCPEASLLILGDSSAAGVGVAVQDQALAGRLVADLARDHVVTWRLEARSGATVAGARRMLAALGPAPFDAVVICLGVNDVKNGVRRAAWRAGYAALLDEVRMSVGAVRIVATGVPPVGRFPALPDPLRRVLGARACAFDADLRALAAGRGARHLPMDFTEEVGQMAADGFHPGAAIYAEWARRVAAMLRRD